MINNLPNLGAAPRERYSQTERNPSVNEQGSSNRSASQKTESDVVKGRTEEFREVLSKKGKTDKSEGPVQPQPTKPTSASERFEGQRSNQGSQKEKAMLKFMDSMESEFGVPPERVVEAMAKLKPEELAAPPEETALQVVDNLGLEKGDQDRALAAYAGMLSALANVPTEQSDSQSEAYPPSHNVEAMAQDSATAAGAASGIVLGSAAQNLGSEVADRNTSAAEDSRPIEGRNQNSSGARPAELSAKERKLMMNQSLDSLAKKFFMSDGSRPTMDPSTLGLRESTGSAALGAGALAAGVFAGADELSSVESSQLMGGPNLESGLVEPQAFRSMDLTESMNLREQPFFLDRQTLQKIEAQKLGMVNPNSALLDYKSMQDPSALPEPVPVGSELSAVDSPVQLGAGLSASVISASGDTAGDSGLTDQGDSDQDSLSSQDANSGLTGPLQQDGKLRAEQGFGAALGAEALRSGMAADGRMSAANMDRLVGQAQMIADRGGGEAIVKLNPEGLGEIKLRVAVKDGRVSVDMAADNPEAKKLIEDSIGELRSALSSHKLSVDQVKVDVGNQLGGDRQSQQESQREQASLDFRQDQGREQARNFLNQFREENMSRREPFFETNAIRNYQRPAKTLAPADEIKAARRYTGEGRGERMNIVA